MKTYINENKSIIALAFLVFVAAYSIKLFTYSYSIDTEIYMINRPNLLNSWLSINRFTLVGLKYITSFIPFNIYLTNWLTVIIYFIGVLFSYYNFASIYPKIKNKKSLFFYTTLIGTSCVFLEQFNFTLQSAEIAFFLVLFETGIFYLIKFIDCKKTKYAIMTIIFQFLSLGAYQSFAPLFITNVLIILFIKIDNKEINFKETIFLILKCASIFVISFILYIIAGKCIQKGMGFESSYLTSQIGWLSNSILANIKHIIKSSFMIYFGFLFGYWEFSLLSCVILIISFIKMIKYLKRKEYLKMLALVLCLASTLLMTVLLANREAIRAMFCLPFILSFFAITFDNNKKYYSVLLTVLLLIQFITMLVYEYNDFKRYQSDVQMAKEIYQIIDPYKDTHQVVFVGNQSSEKENLKGEVIGHSFFDYYQESGRIISFMYSQGYVFRVDTSYTKEAKIIAKNNEIYPGKSYVLVTDNHIIIKLSE